MNTNNSSNRTARTTNDHQGDCFVKQVCDALSPSVCPLCCQHGNAATEAKKGAGRTAEATAAADSRQGATVETSIKANITKAITGRTRFKVDRWLKKLFDLSPSDHLYTLVHMSKTERMYQLLHDAERRGKWQASALHLELEHPDRWAPQVENIIYTDAEHSEKMFRKVGKAGVSNGTSK